MRPAKQALPPKPIELITLVDVAQELGISSDYCYRLLRDGRLALTVYDRPGSSRRYYDIREARSLAGRVLEPDDPEDPPPLVPPKFRYPLPEELVGGAQKAASELGIHLNTFYRWRDSGYLRLTEYKQRGYRRINYDRRELQAIREQLEK